MNKKMLRLGLLVSFLLFFVTACDVSTKQALVSNETKEISKYFPVFGCYSKEGVLYEENTILRFRDYDTRQDIILCNKPNCSHIPYSSINPDPYCNAALPDNELHVTLLYNETLYTFMTNFYSTTIYTKSASAGKWDKFMELPYGYFETEWIVRDGKLYYTAAKAKELVNSIQVSMVPFLMEIDLNEGKFRILKETNDAFSAYFVNHVDDKYLYYSASYTDNTEGSGVEVFRMNLSTFESESLFENNDNQWFIGMWKNEIYYIENSCLYKKNTLEDTVSIIIQSDNLATGSMTNEGIIFENINQENKEVFFYDCFTQKLKNVIRPKDEQMVFKVVGDKILIYMKNGQICVMNVDDYLSEKVEYLAVHGTGIDGNNSNNKKQDMTISWVYNSNYLLGGLDDSIVQELNRILTEEYGYEYTINFVGIEAEDNAEYQNIIRKRYKDKETTDILFSGASYVGEKGAYDMAVKDGLFISLNDLLEETQFGQALFRSFSPAYWETMECFDSIYGIRTSDPQLCYDSTFMVNNTYIQNLNMDDNFSIENIEPFLKDLSVGNKEDLDEICGVYIYPASLCFLEGYIPLIYGYTGLYYQTENDQFEIVNIVEDDRMVELWKKIKEYNDLFQKKYTNPDIQYQAGKFVFAIVPTNLSSFDHNKFNTGQSILTVEKIKSVSEAAVYPQNAVTGIASWSEYPEQAMELLSLIATDSRLSNLITYGIEGIHYQIVDGVVVQIPTEKGSAYRSPASTANHMITYPIGMEPTDKTEQYKAHNDASILSPEVLYHMDYNQYIDRVAAISGVYEKYIGLWNGEYEDIDATIIELKQELNNLGIEELLAELNTHLKEKQ